MAIKQCVTCGEEFKVKESHFFRIKSCSMKCRNISILGRKPWNFKGHKDFGSFYTRWKSMRGRCLNKNSPDYKHYGGRGIKICERWLRFENFREDMLHWYTAHIVGYGQNETTLGRIDNDKGYEPDNCRWETHREQTRNYSRNHLLDFDNKNMTIVEWSEILGISQATIKLRLRRGWDIDKTLSTPHLRPTRLCRLKT